MEKPIISIKDQKPESSTLNQDL